MSMVQDWAERHSQALERLLGQPIRSVEFDRRPSLLERILAHLGLSKALYERLLENSS